MALTKQEFSNYIKQFNFRELFNDMGWNNDNTNQPIVLEDVTYLLKSVAEKSGFKILICNPDASGNIPEYNIRKKIEVKVTKLFQEHLIIFHDKYKKQQIWQLVVRQTGKPTKMTETRYNILQDPELLYQRASGLFFTLDEEEKITIVDVTQRVAENFQQNNERVTKHFYDKFTKEHIRFLSFIKNIDDKLNKDWYASLMLNRLMFCYFIQKKGFLDNNKNYLRDKLKEYKKNKGKNKFFSFYRHFLLTLFHDGLGAPNHNEELKHEIGIIPYLNGGLFDEHELENLYKHIDIDDKAFERIFAFFDEYEWHLDTRITATGRDINPDVIGYIFEKYINDRAEMGAYYTKEDITDYISKNCIIPFIFDETRRHQTDVFATDQIIWGLLKESGDKYIFDSVKYGINPENIFGDLPDDISIGLDHTQLDLLEKRIHWNNPAPHDVGLPTEIWREVIERRNRYSETRKKIEDGEITDINKFITYNLNIRQFFQDIIECIPDMKFVESLYKSLNNITILDPTCGSGAFLFAAMNVLEPIYEGCLQRMTNFINESLNSEVDYFKQALAEVNAPEHPNLQYFIFKSIILRNLYGVDIMNEAVEIAKLRLFLKLVATVEADYRKPNLGLEPLPDIDFNIRAGNTLVGFASKKDVEYASRYMIDGADMIAPIEEKSENISIAFDHYKTIQLTYGEDYKRFKKAKEDLFTGLKLLNEDLNILLHKQASSIKYDNWLESYKPFHWYAEFYEILIDKGGFDVIIGNPPYVVYSSNSFTYQVKDYETLSCANLYAFCAERSFKILNNNGRFGMIIPNSSISADKFSPLQKFFTKDKVTWVSNYSWRPSKLFEGADMLLAIVLSVKAKEREVFSTMYYKWYIDFRKFLFDNIKYYNSTNIFIDGSIPKLPSEMYYSILDKQKQKSGKQTILNCFLNSITSHRFFYFRAVQYWVKILDNEPVFLEDGEKTTTGEMKSVHTDSEEIKYVMVCLLSSSLYFVHYITWASCQVINSRDFTFPFDYQNLSNSLKIKLLKLGGELQKDYQDNSQIIVRNYSKRGRDFTMEKQHFYIKKSKQIIDEIDSVLAEYYCFTNEELDFIINYDIKYRMGRELENGEDE